VSTKSVEILDADLLCLGEWQSQSLRQPHHHRHARYNPDEDEYDPANMVIEGTPADALRVEMRQLEEQLQKLRWTSGAQSSSIRDCSIVQHYEAVAGEIEEELRLLHKALMEQMDVADVEAGVGQPGENSEMYPLPTLLKGPSQYCTKKTEMKPVWSLQTKQGLSGSMVSVSTAYASTAGSSINSISTIGTSQSGTENPEIEALPSPEKKATIVEEFWKHPESESEGIEGVEVVKSGVSDVNCDIAHISMQESRCLGSHNNLPAIYTLQGVLRPGIEISL